MIFGKRAVVSSGTNAQRIIPDQLWDGPAGKILRGWGMMPDGPENTVLSNEEISARWIAEDEQVQREAAEMTRRLAGLTMGAEIKPYYILHRLLWQGRQELLLRWLDVWPRKYCLFLPNTDVGALVLNKFRCPDYYAQEHMKYAEQQLDLMKVEHEQLMKQMPRFDFSAPPPPEVMAFVDRMVDLRTRQLALVDKLAAVFAHMHNEKWQKEVRGAGAK